MPITISDGTYLFDEVEGCSGIFSESRGVPLEVSHEWKDPALTVRVPVNVAGLTPYVTGGTMTEKKMPSPYPMKSIEERLRSPGQLVTTDLLNYSEYSQHLAFVSVSTFAERTGALPRTGSAEDAAGVIAIAKELLSSKEVDLEIAVDEAYIAKYANFSAIELQPMAAFLGGVLAQEVVKCALFLKYRGDKHDDKSIDKEVLGNLRGEGNWLEARISRDNGDGTCALVYSNGETELRVEDYRISTKMFLGKFTPVPGFMHWAAPETLPSTAPVDTAPRNHRNDELAAVFGWDMVDRLGNLNYFMVGCGALGCEFMKNFALNNICCGPEGLLTVTDADRIELSNLTRQFLFRDHNVGQPKSRAAGAMATVMNSTFKVNALELFVGPKSENTFNDTFWQRLDGVCNALDNIEARLYVDGQCVKYEKSLLESGTTGTSGNVDTISPFVTRTYREGGQAAEGGDIPMCTLRNFPHLTDHCIEWSRDQFGLLFVSLGKAAESYLANPDKYEDDKRIKLQSEPGAAFIDIRSMSSLLKAIKTGTIEGCAQLAFDTFQYLFRDRILDLQAFKPKDALAYNDKGEVTGPFWSEKKRYPSVVVFDPSDEYHVSFMTATTCLFASMLGIIPLKREEDATWCREFRAAPGAPSSSAWVCGLVPLLAEVDYIQAPVSGEGLRKSDEEVAAEKAKSEATAVRLFAELRALASGLVLPAVEPAAFEKDDDYNFHIEFVTSAANLRCDNYKIKRTDRTSTKVIAGKIIAAIATTTAAVCGLVILELFKLMQGKDANSLMNRQIGLAVNVYPSFTQDPPRQFKTYVERTVPPPDAELPADAFDEKGVLKDEYIVKTVQLAYPEGHSVWSKIEVPGSLTMRDFAAFLENQHKLRLVRWDFVLGTLSGESDGKKFVQSVTTQIFPPAEVLEYGIIPSLTLSKADAMKAIRQSPKGLASLQKYLNLWEKFKAEGHVPPQPDASHAITADTTLRQTLEIMAVKAELKVLVKEVDTKNIADVSTRSLWVIPGGEGPVTVHAESEEEVAHLAALKILLDR